MSGVKMIDSGGRRQQLCLCLSTAAARTIVSQAPEFSVQGGAMWSEGRMGQLPNMLYLASIWVIPVVIAVTFHEAAHGFVARFLGDETAWKLGRVSLNPIKHIDPFGTILLDLSATPQTLWVLVARG
jgi:hypothetical protein